MRRKMFNDDNKKVAMLFANKIMIDNGYGIITSHKKINQYFLRNLLSFMKRVIILI